MIRRATRTDIPAMARIVADWLAATPWLTDGPAPETLEATIAAARDTREIWVAEGGTDGPVAGYLSMDPDAAWIHGFYVACPGAGTGARLLDRAKRGRTFLQLRTHTPNLDAQRFYAREGFGVVARDLPGHDGPTLLHMEWRT